VLQFIARRPKWIIVTVGILVFCATQTRWITDTHIWQKAGGALVDNCYRVRGERLADPRIVLIGIGDTSLQLDTLSAEEVAASPVLQTMRQPWPWDRSVHAAILEKLMAAGAKVVVFDFVFASETEGDEVFARALEKYKDRVVIGAMISDDAGEMGRTRKVVKPNARLLLSGTESVIGLVTVWPDPDGVVRRVRYRTSIQREQLEIDNTLHPRIAAFWKQHISKGTIPDDLVHLTTRVAEKFQGSVSTPPPGSKPFIDFQGRSGTYRAWPVENLFVDALWKKPPFKNGEAISNNIVIVGPMAEIFKDQHVTPFGSVPGPEIQAQMLSALLQGRWLLEAGGVTNALMALGAMAMALLICLRVQQALIKCLLIGVAIIVLLVSAQLVFTYGRLVTPLMPPLVCILATGSFGIILEYVLEQVERHRYRSILDRYVSKNVANTILEDRRSFAEALKGRKQPVTVLFSDIRGFTTMTESSDADKLVAQLNEYFGDMVGGVLENNGTLQKFIGDAIMAVWGDTISAGIETDARRAVTTALHMRAALARLNATWKENPDRKRLATGIGINHGEVIVGNIGHPQRMEFTVLGDGVNLAARLESATKQFHTDILVGEQVEKLTREHFIYRTVDLLTVKGKTKPVGVFAPLGTRSETAPAWLEAYEKAVALYRRRQFQEAAVIFESVRTQIGGEDFLCDMYLSRCAAYQASPPPENWDGSFTLSEK
jgi:adenylate cyclase